MTRAKIKSEAAMLPHPVAAKARPRAPIAPVCCVPITILGKGKRLKSKGKGKRLKSMLERLKSMLFHFTSPRSRRILLEEIDKLGSTSRATTSRAARRRRAAGRRQAGLDKPGDDVQTIDSHDDDEPGNDEHGGFQGDDFEPDYGTQTSDDEPGDDEQGGFQGRDDEPGYDEQGGFQGRDDEPGYDMQTGDDDIPSAWLVACRHTSRRSAGLYERGTSRPAARRTADSRN
jgi:hypothetical protein